MKLSLLVFLIPALKERPLLMAGAASMNARYATLHHHGTATQKLNANQLAATGAQAIMETIGAVTMTVQYVNQTSLGIVTHKIPVCLLEGNGA